VFLANKSFCTDEKVGTDTLIIQSWFNPNLDVLGRRASTDIANLPSSNVG
jgi:hypothetical protein